jgi:hypothetical protein
MKYLARPVRGFARVLHHPRKFLKIKADKGALSLQVHKPGSQLRLAVELQQLF